MIVEQFGQGGLNTLMLIELYIEALLVDEERADQVWEAWDQGEIDDKAVRAGKKARIGFPVHPHMLRHSTGYKLANDGHDTRAIQHYLGHKNIQHTVRYTELSANRFNDFWQD